jgi:hypothetical protein
MLVGVAMWMPVLILDPYYSLPDDAFVVSSFGSPAYSKYQLARFTSYRRKLESDPPAPYLPLKASASSPALEVLERVSSTRTVSPFESLPAVPKWHSAESLEIPITEPSLATTRVPSGW